MGHQDASAARSDESARAERRARRACAQRVVGSDAPDPRAPKVADPLRGFAVSARPSTATSSGIAPCRAAAQAKGGGMGLDLEDLDDTTRRLMAQEFDEDEASGRVYPSDSGLSTRLL